MQQTEIVSPRPLYEQIQESYNKSMLILQELEEQQKEEFE